VCERERKLSLIIIIIIIAHIALYRVKDYKLVSL